MRGYLVSTLIVAAVAGLAAQKMERPGIVNYTKVDAVVALDISHRRLRHAGLLLKELRTPVALSHRCNQGSSEGADRRQGHSTRSTAVLRRYIRDSKLFTHNLAAEVSL